MSFPTIRRLRIIGLLVTLPILAAAFFAFSSGPAPLDQSNGAIDVGATPVGNASVESNLNSQTVAAVPVEELEPCTGGFLDCDSPGLLPEQQAIVNLRSQIGAYGVVVTFDAGVSIDDRIMALQMMVEVTSNYAANIVSNSQQSDEMQYVLFKQTMLATTVHVADVTSFGETLGHNSRVFAEGELVGFDIILALGGLSGEAAYPHNQMGDNLVAHEYAHNLTYQGYDYLAYDSGTHPYSMLASYYASLLGVQVGSDAYRLDEFRDASHEVNGAELAAGRPSQYDVDWVSELNADYIASTVMGRFAGEEELIAGRVNGFLQWKLGLMGDF